MNYDKIPDRAKFKCQDELHFGVSPFDDLSKEDLLRVIHVLYPTVTSMAGVLRQCKLSLGPHWAEWYQERLDQAHEVIEYVGDESAAYHAFYRYSSPILFGEDDRAWYVAPNGDIIKPIMGDPPEGSRLMTMDDLKPTENAC